MGTLDMIDAPMTESLDIIEPLTDADCTDCSSIIPRIGVRPEIVRETELMTRPKTDLELMTRPKTDLDPLDLNSTIKTRKTESNDA